MSEQGLIKQFERNMKLFLGMKTVRAPKTLLDISYVTFIDLRYLFIFIAALIAICVIVFLCEVIFANLKHIGFFGRYSCLEKV